MQPVNFAGKESITGPFGSIFGVFAMVYPKEAFVAPVVAWVMH
jgi:hypothetical protein